MRKILLNVRAKTQNYKRHTALVDDADFDYLNQWRWSYHGGPDGYAKRTGDDNKSIFMHRLILQPPRGMVCDHKDGNKLNNRRSNLRVATQSQNGANSRTKVGRFKGVTKVKKAINPKNRYLAQITLRGQYFYLGYFYTAELAAEAYNKKALELYGEFAGLNNFKKK